MNNLLLYLFIFFLGTCIGSFLNVCIYRFPIKQSVVFGHSYCPTCGTRLKWIDLFPCFSYLLLGRKCRYCHQKISPRYMLIELLTGICFTLLLWKFGVCIDLLIYCLFTCTLIIITFIDIDTMEIPNGSVLTIILLVLFHISFNITSLSDNLIGMLIAFLPILLLFVISLGSAMGFGDVKLMFSCGLLLGAKCSAAALIIGIIVGGIWGVIVLISKKISKTTATLRGIQMPFGPSLCIGCYLALLFGQEIVNWYLSLLLP